MSYYTTRIIEVKVLACKGESYNFENLVNQYKDIANEGDYFILYENFKPQTVKYINGEFILIDEQIPKVWKLVKFYSDDYCKKYSGENELFEINNIRVSPTSYWCNSGGDIRDKFISSSGYDKQIFTGRGIPTDISKETSELLSSTNEYFDFTWVTLSEWQELYNIKLKQFQQKIAEFYNKNTLDVINTKLDTILDRLDNIYYKNKCKSNKEFGWDNYENELTYIWDDLFSELEQISYEISKNAALAEHFIDSYVKYDDVRILYCIS